MTLKALMEEVSGDSSWKSLQKTRSLVRGAISRADRIALAEFLTGEEPRHRLDFERRCVRIAVASDGSFENLKEPLALRLAERGMFCDFFHSPYGQIAQEVRNSSAGLMQHRPEIVVLAPFANLWTRIRESEITDPQQLVDEAWTHVAALRGHFLGMILLVNALPSESRTHGILESRRDVGHVDLARSLNLLLSSRCRQTNAAYVVDAEFLAAQSGASWTSLHKQYWLASRSLSDELASRVALDVAAFCAALKGFARKCLALDLDNTMWGGVVGEDGWKGVKLGGSYPANLYVELQREFKKLHDRGVTLTIISKNNEADAWEVFDRRPEMWLKRSDISAYRINWNDKARNLRELAKELNIGLDAFVVMDDNPVERAWIEDALPEVDVCPAGDPLEMLRWLSSCGRFDTLAITNEDALRAKSYAAAEERKKIESSSSSLEEYLTTLQTVVNVGALTHAQLSRVAQLTQKTNQFNLTTRRYSESDLQHRMDDPTWHIYWCGCRDRFADEGIIGVAIAVVEEDVWRLDTFLLSCRVLGRGVERAFLQVVCDEATRGGATGLIGEFNASPKNAQTEGFYDSCGFRELEGSPAHRRWRLDLPALDRLSPPALQVRTHNLSLTLVNT